MEPNGPIDKLNMSLDDLLASKRPLQRQAAQRPAEQPKKRKQIEPESTTIQVARRVYVSNLTYETQWQELKDHFRKAGNVVHADVLMDPRTGRSKGCGIVEFESSEDAAKAIEHLDESQLDGRVIYVREDREDPDLKEYLGHGESRRAKAPRPSYNSSFVHKEYNAPPPIYSTRSFGRDSGPAVVGRRLYVHNLRYETTWGMLKDHFRTAGEVLFADIIQDNAGRSKGCGIVEFSSPAEAAHALRVLDNSELDGRQIFVREDRDEVAAAVAQMPRRPVPSNYFGHEDRMFGSHGRVQPPRATTPRPSGAPGARKPAAAPGCQVVVHGIPWSFAWQDLKDLMHPAGAVLHADVAFDSNGRSKGFGVVIFATPEDASHAISTINGTELQGRIITVKPDKFAS